MKQSKQNFKKLPHYHIDSIYNIQKHQIRISEINAAISSSHILNNPNKIKIILLSPHFSIETIKNWLPIYDRFKEYYEINFHCFSLNDKNFDKILPDTFEKNIVSFSSIDSTELFKLIPNNIQSNNGADSENSIIVIKDKSDNYRGVFFINEMSEVDRLKDELKVLLYEYHEPR